MTKKELLYVSKVLNRIKPLDEHIMKAIKYIEKDLASYEAMRGQLKDQYEYDSRGDW